MLFLNLASFVLLLAGRPSHCTPPPPRIDCHPDVGATASRCASRGCRWTPTSGARQPWCVFAASDPKTVAGYDASPDGDSTDRWLLTRRDTPTLYGGDLKRLAASYQPLTDSTFRIVMKKPLARRPEHHIAVGRFLRRTQSNPTDFEKTPPLYAVDFQRSPFGFTVARAASVGAATPPLFDTTNLPGLTFARRFIQLSTRPSTGNVYGFGEQRHRRLRHDFAWRRHSLFNQDHEPQEGMNLYGFHPFYMGLDAANKAYGVYLHTTYPMDVVLQPEPNLITFRIVGGDDLQLYFFMGPTADDVITQYSALIGRPHMPPYWALGFQLSRFGLKNTSMVEELWRRNRAARIPQDTQVIDIDYMRDRLDFTYDPVRFNGLPEFVEKAVHASGRKLVPIVDPGIASRPKQPYTALNVGKDMNVFIRKYNTSIPFEGKVWPGFTYFPDFTLAKNVTKYWTQVLSEFHNTLPFDGIWIDMNDPSNFLDGSASGCSNNDLNHPPFLPVNYQPLYRKTLCMDAQLQNGDSHLQWHNYYGHHETVVTNRALQSIFSKDDDKRAQRPFVLTRSTAPGTGAYGAHWTGDVISDWASLNQSVIAMLEMNMFGIPFVGADICGFNGETTEELCLRWHQLGAFYPFCRNHNSDDNKVDQDPAAWPSATREAIRLSLARRYSLLPYLYTLLHRAHTTGRPVVRPLFYDFPDDPQTHDLHEQFLWGRHLMVAPVLAPGVTARQVYFPEGSWYDLNDMLAAVPNAGRSRWLGYPTPRDHIGLFLRERSVVVWQRPVESTAESRLSPFGATVALPSLSRRRNALPHAFNDSFFWDDGLTTDDDRHCLVMFTCVASIRKGALTVTPVKSDCDNMPVLNEIQIANVASKPTHVILNDRKVRSVVYVRERRVLLITNVNIRLKSVDTTLSWK